MSRAARRWLARAAVAIALEATPAARADVEAVRRCLRDNAPDTTAAAVVELTVTDREGEASVSRAKAWWRGDRNEAQRLLLRYLAPDDLVGAALLLKLRPGAQPIVHLYLPEIGTAQRIYSAEKVQAFLGRSDFDAGELEWLLDVAGDARLALLDAPAALAGRPVWSVDARPAEGKPAVYSRITALVDREWCLPLEVTFHDGDAPRKVLRLAPGEVRRAGESWVPHRVELEDLRLGSRSAIRVESIEVDVPIGPALLTPRGLESEGARASGVAAP